MHFSSYWRFGASRRASTAHPRSKSKVKSQKSKVKKEATRHRALLGAESNLQKIATQDDDFTPEKVRKPAAKAAAQACFDLKDARAGRALCLSESFRFSFRLLPSDERHPPSSQ
jgi:hypothetical protein